MGEAKGRHHPGSIERPREMARGRPASQRRGPFQTGSQNTAEVPEAAA
ncbi:Protein of unknown function [Pyronema omphalodes CBS 100304]|uniref:Uncharacterized protein n=1 Tax=Pyronema omphalodes (strain CBS 100304) TaxID=1076935 RepID=U4LM19_PYROM|nr:Protein of unknown function [Pyronema omphalodes CBS 100304]